MRLNDLLKAENQDYSLARGKGTKANVAFVRLFGVEPNFFKRLLAGGRGSSEPMTTRQIASVLRSANLVRDEEALERAEYLTEGSPKPSFFIGLRAGGLPILCDREYYFVKTGEETYRLKPAHFVAPGFALG